MQTLKSVQTSRVDSGKSYNSAAHRLNLGEGLFCPAGAQLIQHDIYGRPASQNTIGYSEGGFFTQQPSCAQYSQYPTSRYMQIENNQRPYLPIAAAGIRGQADFLNVGRDLLPQNLYGDGQRGAFVTFYNTTNDAPYDNPVPQKMDYYNLQMRQPYDYSHATAVKSATYHN